MNFLVDTDAILKRQNSNQWFKDGKAKIREILKIKDIVKKAKGAILTIGDGMGPSTVTAARILDGQNKGMTGMVFHFSSHTFKLNVFSYEMRKFLENYVLFTIDSRNLRLRPVVCDILELRIRHQSRAAC